MSLNSKLVVAEKSRELMAWTKMRMTPCSVGIQSGAFQITWLEVGVL
jgi:hypothetical protein